MLQKCHPLTAFVVSLALTVTMGIGAVAIAATPYPEADAVWPGSVCVPDLMLSGADYFTATGQIENQATSAREFHCPLESRSTTVYDPTYGPTIGAAPHGDVFVEVYDHSSSTEVACTLYRRRTSRSTYFTYTSASTSASTTNANVGTYILSLNMTTGLWPSSNAVYYYHAACEMPAGTGAIGSRINAFYAPGFN